MRIHAGTGLANVAEEVVVGGGGGGNVGEVGDGGEGAGVGARFVPVVERAASREVVATAVAALAVAEGTFGARGVRGGVRVGEVQVGELVVWFGGEREKGVEKRGRLIEWGFEVA